MATDTGHVAAIVAGASNTDDNLFVALEASGLRHVEVSPRNVNLLREMTRREGERVEESVHRFRRVLSDESRRRVTVVAHRDLSMT
jgi:hypothetical protein